MISFFRAKTELSWFIDFERGRLGFFIWILCYESILDYSDVSVLQFIHLHFCFAFCIGTSAFQFVDIWLTLCFRLCCVLIPCCASSCLWLSCILATVLLRFDCYVVRFHRSTGVYVVLLVFTACTLHFHFSFCFFLLFCIGLGLGLWYWITGIYLVLLD